MVAVSFAFFYLLFNKNSVKSDMDISLIGPDTVASGEVLEFLVKLENNSKLDYRDINLIVDFPESTVDADKKNFLKKKDMVIEEPLLAGGQISKKFRVLLSGAEGEKKDIEISVYYRAGDFSNILFSKRIYSLKIESAPVSVEMEYPPSVQSGKEFDFRINVLSNSGETLNDLVIISKYPSGFKLLSSKPEAVFSNDSQNIFKIESLEPGQKKSIEVKGVLFGENKENKFFSFEVGDSVPFTNEIRTVFAKSENEIVIRDPDLNLKILASGEGNDDGDLIVYAGSDFNLALFLSNNIDAAVSNLKILASFEGDDLLDKKEVDVPKGFYSSTEGTILWDKTTDEALKSLAAGARVREDLSLSLVDLERVAGYIKDPQMTINFKVSGTGFNNENPEGFISEKFSKKIKLATGVFLKSSVVYAGGPFKNTGPNEPVVGQATTYTVA